MKITQAELQLVLEKHLKWLRNEEGGSRADLRDADLRGAVLRDADLRDAVLSGAVLRDADLRGAGLSDADLSDADLSDADLRGADLSDADLSDADLSDADLSDADLSDADLRDAVLRDADLRGAVLRDADLRGAVLRDADLRGADLRGADLSGAVLSGAVLRDADLRGADLRGADLRGADLREPTPEEYKEIAARYRERHPEVPVVPRLDKQICDLVHAEKIRLEMGSWHGDFCDETNWCETTHCRAGAAICLAGKEGFDLERKYDAERAGGMIYRASTGRWPNFFADNDEALEDICKWAALDAAEDVPTANEK